MMVLMARPVMRYFLVDVMRSRRKGAGRRTRRPIVIALTLSVPSR